MATGGSGFSPAAGWDRTPPTFSTVRRGYDPEQVLAYLARVAERMEGLETRLRRAEKERDETRRERDVALETWDKARNQPYESMAGHLADLMRKFDAEVERLEAEAEAESGRILDEARGEAERIRLQAAGTDAEARRQAEHVLREAREEADRVLRQAREEAEQIESDLFAVHGSMLNELQIIRDHMRNAIGELEVVLSGRPPDEPVVVIEDAGGGAQREEMSLPRQEAPHQLGR